LAASSPWLSVWPAISNCAAGQVLNTSAMAAITPRLTGSISEDPGRNTIDWLSRIAVTSSGATQKAIVLGKGGSRIKAIGEAARKELSELLSQKVHLFLHVKVDENWEDNREIYEEMGLDWVR
jgi:hypothetical protein